MNVYPLKNEINMEQVELDLMYLRSFYSPVIVEILPLISQVLDTWDYEDSPLYDAYTDRLHIWKIIDEIYKKAAYLENMYQPVGEENENMKSSGHCVSCRSGESWLKNLIISLVVGEIGERRRRKWMRVGNWRK